MSTLLTIDTAITTGLSARELDVLRCLADGWSNSGIAARLFVSERTVESHLHAIMLKLALEPRAETNRRVLAATAWRAVALSDA